MHVGVEPEPLAERGQQGVQIGALLRAEALGQRGLLRLGIRVPGPGIGFFGGISASVLLGISGLLAWAHAQTAGLSASVSRLVSELVFVLGGVGFGGLLWLTTVAFLLPRNRHDVDGGARRRPRRP